MIKLNFNNEATLFTKDIVNNILESLSVYEEDVRIIKVVPYVQPSYSNREQNDKGIILKLQHQKHITTHNYYKNKPFEELFVSYSNKQPYSFVFDGEKLLASNTPYLYGMEDGDIIDVI